jgi:hypothetical protein
MSTIDYTKTQTYIVTFGDVCSFNEDSELDSEGSGQIRSTLRALSGRGLDVIGRWRVSAVAGVLTT